MQRQQDRIPCGRDEDAVELPVHLHELIHVACCGQRVLDLERDLHALGHADLAADHAFDCMSLDEQTGVHDVLDLVGRYGDHEGAALWIEAKQTFGLQAYECLANRRAADPDLVGDQSLGEELAARVTAVQDPRFRELVGAVSCLHRMHLSDSLTDATVSDIDVSA